MKQTRSCGAQKTKILQKCFLLTNCRPLFDNVNIRHKRDR